MCGDNALEASSEGGRRFATYFASDGGMFQTFFPSAHYGRVIEGEEGRSAGAARPILTGAAQVSSLVPARASIGPLWRIVAHSGDINSALYV